MAIQINDYELGKRLGAGAKSTVHLTTHKASDNPVAIKIIKNVEISADLQPLFDAHIHAITQLKHKHILPVYDYGYQQEHEQLYVVMELIEGHTLRDIIRHQSLSLDTISKLLYQTGIALDYVHVHDLIHGNLKPSNILINEAGFCFLSDISVLPPNTVNTLTRFKTEQPNYYASPEQLKGELITSASDVYSLGCILAEMLLPGFEVQQYFSNAPVPVLAHYRDDLNTHFQHILDKALALRPAHRFESCHELFLTFRNAVKELQNTVNAENEIPQFPPQAEQHLAEMPDTNETIGTRPPTIFTAPLGYISVQVIVPDSPGLTTSAQVRRNIIVKDFLVETCRQLNIPRNKRTFMLNGAALQLNRTFGQNNIPPKAVLELVLTNDEKNPTKEWIANNITPLSFGSNNIISLVDEDTQMRFPLTAQPAIIGRKDTQPEIEHINNFLQIDLSHIDRSNRISRQHACITRRDGQFYVEALSPWNHTYLNNKLLQYNRRYPIQVGDRITVGPVNLIFQIY